jgi:hypothetical protein
MKKYLIIFLGLIIFFQVNDGFCQTPQGFKYQTAIRDNSGNLLANKLVALKISILRTSASGSAVYIESHNVSTTDFGIANLNIGNGNVVQGNFSQIDWANGPYFLKTELDINNGTNFLFMGTTQLLSVPFALYAAKSANAENDFDKDSLNEIQQMSLNGNQLQLNKAGGTVNLDKYIDNTDSQSISLQGNTLSISRGNSIVLSGAVDLDSDPTNEIQNLSLNKDTIKISKGNFILLPKDIDGDSTNEIQSLSQAGNTINLNKNGGTADVAKTSNVQNGSLLFATASGSNNILLTLTPAPTTYTAGMIINFKVAANNSGPVNINVNGLGSKPLFKNVVDSLGSNDMVENQMASIIYDGNRFQFLVAPYAKSAEKANKLNNDSTGGLIPQGGMIATETEISNPGFTYTGQSFASILKQVVLNEDSLLNNKFKYLGKVGNNIYYYSVANPSYPQRLMCISRYDTATNKFVLISSRQLNTNYSDLKVEAKIFNNIIYFASFSSSSSNRRIYLEEYNISTNTWSVKYTYDFYYNGYLEIFISNLYYFNGSLFMSMIFSEPGLIMNNTIGTNLFKFNLSSSTLNLMETISSNTIYQNVSGNFYKTINDTIYKMNSSMNWIYFNIFGKKNYSGTDMFIASDLIYYKDYILNTITNTFIQRRSFTSLFFNGYFINKFLFVSPKGFPNKGLSYMILTDSTISSPVNFGKDVQMDVEIKDIIVKSNGKLLCMGENTLSEITLPKIYYYHRKL